MTAETLASDSAPVLGHVHLRVSDLNRAIAFYRDVVGLDLMTLYGTQAAFLSSQGYHHYLGLNTWDSAGGAAPDKRRAGLYHSAWLYPDRATLAQAVRRALAAGHVLTGKADHGVSEAVYLDDPDGNGVELYRDRATTDWPRDADGKILVSNTPLDLDALLSEAPPET
ncbi:catechol 2,3-dioxygenase [Jannaschia faecimaris]|uniref:Catechol 2,3-dioxygenase n=1 Tax=Jannaschia faecimaris TaxID=1244108 RepID=A0A1H3SHJ0_9RHOB|nr:VOC family protein [Jannaschia faecimaris]SDZ37432.1 catechol 2,3-dioxygenase [Jannaschia faecimaris]